MCAGIAGAVGPAVQLVRLRRSPGSGLWTAAAEEAARAGHVAYLPSPGSPDGGVYDDRAG